jgi:hypothetical protein
VICEGRAERAERARRRARFVGVRVGAQEERHAGLTEHEREPLDRTFGDCCDVDGERRDRRRRPGLSRETVEPQLDEPCVELEHRFGPNAEIDATRGLVAHECIRFLHVLFIFDFFIFFLFYFFIFFLFFFIFLGHSSQGTRKKSDTIFLLLFLGGRWGPKQKTTVAFFFSFFFGGGG